MTRSAPRRFPIPGSSAAPVVLRWLGPADAGFVVRNRQLFDEPPSRRSTSRYLADPQNLFLVAKVGTSAVGFLRGTILKQIHTGLDQAFLYEVAVAPRYQRRGVGRALVEEFLRRCLQRRCMEAFVFTDDPANIAAARLYRRTGGRTETRGDRMYVYRLRRR